MEAITGFIWANLPFDISQLILDALEWPTHAVCRQVCHSWRVYLDQPRLVAKRYHSPIIANRAIHKTRDANGAVVTNVFELPTHEAKPLKQIHRILTEPGLAFFIYRNPETDIIKFGSCCFFAPERTALYRFRTPRNETDLRGYFPGVVVGRMTKIMFNPEYDEIDSGSEKEGVEEYTPQPIGPWCLKMDYIPFADEPVIPQTSMPVQFVPRFVSLSEPQISVAVQQYLEDYINKLPRPPKVRELVVGIGGAIAGYFQRDRNLYMDEKGIFISFRGIMNVHDSTPGLLPIVISVENMCEWLEGEDEEDDADE